MTDLELQGGLLGQDQNQKSKTDSSKAKETWGNDIEFLFSCISLSVGLGNIWRFPYIAFQNGGGTFVIPYLIVLLIIGRPVYYLEILLGQFCGKGCIKAFDMAPVMKGKTEKKFKVYLKKSVFHHSPQVLLLARCWQLQPP